MGFFDSVFKVVKSIGRTVLETAGVIPERETAFSAQKVQELRRQGRASAQRAEILRRTARERKPELIGGGLIGDEIVTGAVVGGNGLSFRRTLVQTVDRSTNKVLETQVLRGAPFIMRHDIQIAKRVIRTASKLGRMKGISRVVKQSISSRTKDAIEAKVLAQVTKEIC